MEIIYGLSDRPRSRWDLSTIRALLDGPLSWLGHPTSASGAADHCRRNSLYLSGNQSCDCKLQRFRHTQPSLSQGLTPIPSSHTGAMGSSSRNHCRRWRLCWGQPHYHQPLWSGVNLWPRCSPTRFCLRLHNPQTNPRNRWMDLASMKRLLLALALLLISSGAFAQCNGVFANGTVCGNNTGTSNTPRAVSPASLLGAAGGANGQTQYNNSGVLGGYTPNGDCTVVTATGVFTCLKTNGVSFGPFATANATTATAALNVFTSTLQGVAPASGGGTANFLRADST